MARKYVPKTELEVRLNRFCEGMDGEYPDWEVCIIVGHMSIYYLTGTICDGLILIQRGKDAVLWVRESYERALIESQFPNIRKLVSFRELAESMTAAADTLYLDMSAATMEWYQRLSKYLRFSGVLPADKVMMTVRSVKTEYEREIMLRDGGTIRRLLEDEVPKLLRGGMSEAELGAAMFTLFVENGYHGISRFLMRGGETIMGHIGFDASPIYPSMFTGASGTPGLCAAGPVLGDRDTKLREGGLVYVDVCFGTEGYNLDKTLVYSYGKPQPDAVNKAHNHCLELQALAASMLKPGVSPAEIYEAVSAAVLPEYSDCFMGAPGRTVRFIGHGIGLYVDELPVIAKGFDEPLVPGVAVALEPKIGLEGVGLAGNENTYLVTETGAVSLTGERREIIVV